MGSTERLHLRWNDFESNIKHGFSELRADEEFFDVTLAVGGKQIKAHKVILSACSPFFCSLIKSGSHAHPLLYLRGIKSSHLEALLCFMYNGEVNVVQEELSGLLAVAEELQIRGLTQDQSSEEAVDQAPPSKRPRLKQQPSIVKPSPPANEAITFTDDDDIQDVTPVKDEQQQHEEKYVPSANPPASSNPPAIYDDNELHEEKYIEEKQEYIPDEQEYNDDPGMDPPQGSSSMPPNENEEATMIAALDKAIEALIVKKDGVWTCKRCDVPMSNKNNLVNHIEAKHMVTDGFACSTCNTLYKTRHSLRQHNYIKHNKKEPAYYPTRV
uniref:Broad-complex core protein isoform 6 n=1 Tax=Caligus clemensi TaxID=344056 RepID=C1C3A0_CALCM|nr:Broad-complex core protein isoform 6 [Caligus clemensi]